MVKTITIGNKAFNLKASAKTPFVYSEVTSNQKNFFKELDKIKDAYGEGQNVSVADFGEIQEFILHLTYAMFIQENRDTKLSYLDFIDGIEDMGDGRWIGEVLQLAMSTFPRGIQATDNN